MYRPNGRRAPSRLGLHQPGWNAVTEPPTANSRSPLAVRPLDQGPHGRHHNVPRDHPAGNSIAGRRRRTPMTTKISRRLHSDRGPRVRGAGCRPLLLPALLPERRTNGGRFSRPFSSLLSELPRPVRPSSTSARVTRRAVSTSRMGAIGFQVKGDVMTREGRGEVLEGPR